MKILTFALVATGLAAIMYKSSARRESKPLVPRAGHQPSLTPTDVSDNDNITRTPYGEER